MAKTVATLLGAIFILVGLVGFVSHDFMGAHLTTAHNIIHLVSGAVSLFLGLKGTLASARLFGLIFGAVYLLLGIAGFLLGGGNPPMLTLIDNTLAFGTVDHIIHVIFGVLYLIGALLTKGDASDAGS